MLSCQQGGKDGHPHREMGGSCRQEPLWATVMGGPRTPITYPTTTHAHQWLQLLGVNEAKLSDKVVEVLVAGVDVSL